MIDIKRKLDKYLEFDSNELFFDPMVRIFGGAIRDSIVGDPIKDVDILTGSKSLKLLEFLLEKNGYIFQESLIPKDLASIYTDIHVISEPHTWVKGTKIVQLIRPSKNFKISPDGSNIKDASDFKTYYQMFLNLIENVDISCCGVSYDGINIYENYPDAILYCKTKSFSINHTAAMYSEKRIEHRRAKLLDRGWRQVQGKVEKRDLIIEGIIGNKIEIEYIAYGESSNLEFSTIGL